MTLRFSQHIFNSDQFGINLFLTPNWSKLIIWIQTNFWSREGKPFLDPTKAIYTKDKKDDWPIWGQEKVSLSVSKANNYV